MRRPNRNIELFSLSVLDLFSAAMGAFIMIAIVLFPYYMKNKDLRDQNRDLANRVVGLTTENDGLRGQLGTCQAEGAAARARADENAKRADDNARAAATANDDVKKCMLVAGKNFMVTVIEWRFDGFDVDLHVRDPQGREFFYNKTTHAGSPAELSLDNKFGPGIEVWQHPEAPPGGPYCVGYVLYEIFNKHKDNPNVSVEVRGKIFYRGGNRPLPAIRLTRTQQFAAAAAVTLEADGNLTVAPAGSCFSGWSPKFEKEIKRARPF
jgi:hypothetical protein